MSTFSISPLPCRGDLFLKDPLLLFFVSLPTSCCPLGLFQYHTRDDSCHVYVTVGSCRTANKYRSSISGRINTNHSTCPRNIHTWRNHNFVPLRSDPHKLYIILCSLPISRETRLNLNFALVAYRLARLFTRSATSSIYLFKSTLDIIHHSSDHASVFFTFLAFEYDTRVANDTSTMYTASCNKKITQDGSVRCECA